MKLQIFFNEAICNPLHNMIRQHSDLTFHLNEITKKPNVFWSFN